MARYGQTTGGGDNNAVNAKLHKTHHPQLHSTSHVDLPGKGSNLTYPKWIDVVIIIQSHQLAPLWSYLQHKACHIRHWDSSRENSNQEFLKQNSILELHHTMQHRMGRLNEQNQSSRMVQGNTTGSLEIRVSIFLFHYRVTPDSYRSSSSAADYGLTASSYLSLKSNLAAHITLM